MSRFHSQMKCQKGVGGKFQPYAFLWLPLFYDVCIFCFFIQIFIHTCVCVFLGAFVELRRQFSFDS